jgi:hypothetical protein
VIAPDLRFPSWLIILSSFLLLAGASGCKKPEQPKPPPEPPDPPRTELASTQELSAAAPIPAAESNAPPVSAAVLPLAQPPAGLLLRVKWPAGARYVYRMDLDQRSTNTLAHAPRPSEEALDMGLTYAVLVTQPAADLRCELEIEFLAYELEIKQGGKVVMSFDSLRAGPALAQGFAFTEPFSRIIGTKVRLLLQPDGSVREVLGLSDWVKSVARDAVEPAEQMLVQQFNEGFFRQIVEFGRGLPPDPVSAGASWPYHAEVPGGALGQMNLDSTITFRAIEEHDERKLAVLDSTGLIQSARAPAGQEAGAIWIERGSIKGTSWFDPGLGALVESLAEQQMRLSGRTASPAGKQLEGLPFTSDIGQRVTVKLVASETERPPLSDAYIKPDPAPATPPP